MPVLAEVLAGVPQRWRVAHLPARQQLGLLELHRDNGVLVEGLSPMGADFGAVGTTAVHSQHMVMAWQEARLESGEARAIDQVV